MKIKSFMLTVAATGFIIFSGSTSVLADNHLPNVTYGHPSRGGHGMHHSVGMKQHMKPMHAQHGQHMGARHHKPRFYASYPHPVYYSHPWTPPYIYESYGVEVILGPAVYGYPAAGPTPLKRHKHKAHYKKANHSKGTCSQITHKIMTQQGIEYRTTKRCGA